MVYVTNEIGDDYRRGNIRIRQDVTIKFGL